MGRLSGIAAAPCSRASLRNLAWEIRKKLGLEDEPYLPVLHILEMALGKIAPGFSWDVCDRAEMGGNHGLTLIDEKIIEIREDVSKGARAGCGRDRMTILHEIGHAILHGGSIALGRRLDREIKVFEDPEWQAKAFAGEFAICSRLIGGCKNHFDLMNRFGVSEDAAKVQMAQFQKEGLWLPSEKKQALVATNARFSKTR